VGLREVHKDCQYNNAENDNHNWNNEDNTELIIQHPTSNSNLNKTRPNVVKRSKAHIDVFYVGAHQGQCSCRMLAVVSLIIEV
jgi:hypothetical protein